MDGQLICSSIKIRKKFRAHRIITGGHPALALLIIRLCFFFGRLGILSNGRV